MTSQTIAMDRDQRSCAVVFLIDDMPQKVLALGGVISRQWAVKILNTLKGFKLTGAVYWQWCASKKIRGLLSHKFFKQVYSDSESNTELNKINILFYTEEYQRKALTIRDRIKRLAEKRSIYNQFKARCQRNMDADQLHITFLYGSPFFSRELSKANSQTRIDTDLKYPVRYLRVLNAMIDVLANAEKSISLDFEQFNENSLRKGLRARAAWSSIDQSLRGNDILFCVLFGQEVEQEFDKKQAKRKMFFGENKFGGLQLISAEVNRSVESSSEIKTLIVQTNCMEAARQMFQGCAKNTIYIHSNVLQEDEAAERFTRVFFESLIVKAMTEFQAFEEARTQASQYPSAHTRCLRFRKQNSIKSCPYPLYQRLANCCKEVEDGDQNKERFQERDKFEGYFYGPARKSRLEKGNLLFDVDLRDAIKKAQEVAYAKLELDNRIQTAKVFYERKKLMQSNIKRLSVNVNGRQGSGKAYLKDYLLNCMRIKQMLPRDTQAACSERYGSMSPAEAEWLSSTNVGFLVWDNRHLRDGSRLEIERAESLVNRGKYNLLVVSTEKLHSNIDIECKPQGDGMLERKDLPLEKEVGGNLSSLANQASKVNRLIVAHLKGLLPIEGQPVPNPQKQILFDATAHNPCSMFSVWLQQKSKSIPQIQKTQRDSHIIAKSYDLIRNAASDFVQTADLPEQLLEMVCLVINVKLMNRSKEKDFEFILQSIQESLRWALAATLSAYSAEVSPQESYPTTKVELLAIVSELLLQVRLESLLLSCSDSQSEQKKLERTHELMSAIKRSLRRQIQQQVETPHHKVLLVALSFNQHLAYQVELFAQQGNSTTQRQQHYLKEFQQAAYYCKLPPKLSDNFSKLGLLADQLRSPQMGAPDEKSRLGIIIELVGCLASLERQQKLAQKLNNLEDVSKLFERCRCLQAKLMPVEGEDNQLAPANKRPIWMLLRKKLSEAKEVLNGLITEHPIFTLVVAAQREQLPFEFESRFTLDKNNSHIQIERVSANFADRHIPSLLQRGSQYYCIWYGKWEADAAADPEFLKEILNLGKDYYGSKAVFVCNRWIDPTAWSSFLTERNSESGNWPVLVNLSRQHQYREFSDDYQGQLLIQSIVEYLVRNIELYKSGDACMPELIQTIMGKLNKPTWAAFVTSSQLNKDILADFLSCFRMFVPYDQDPIGIQDSVRWVKSRGAHKTKAHSELLASPRPSILSSGNWGFLNPAHLICAAFATATRQNQDTLVGFAQLVCRKRQWYEDGLIQIDCRTYEMKLIGNMEYEAVQFVEDELGHQLPELEYKKALLIFKGAASLILSRTYPRLRRLLEKIKSIRILFIGEQALRSESFSRDKLELADIG